MLQSQLPGTAWLLLKQGAASSVDREHQRCPDMGSPFLLTSHHSQPPQDLSPCWPTFRHPSSSSPRGKEQFATSPLPFRRRGCCHFSQEHTDHAKAVLLFPLATCAGSGRTRGLEKGWPCLPPLRSSPGNTSGLSRSAQTNVSSTADRSGRGIEGKRQEGNG